MQEKEWSMAGGSLRYAENRGQIEITGWQGTAGEVTVPESIEGHPVTAIGKKAFLSKKNLRKVNLPETIREIGDWAFAYCDSLVQVTMGSLEITFGKAVFLECGSLRLLTIAGKSETVAALLASAVWAAGAYYLLSVEEAGNREWFSKWDARMLAVLRGADDEGYSRQVLCGEEDYGSTDLEAFRSEQRKKKVRLLFLRLLYPDYLDSETEAEMREYLKAHTKGCTAEETWQVVLKEHGNDKTYYELFTELGCVSEENFNGLIDDIGEDYPEMKAYLMRYKAQQIGYTDFFADLDI